MKRSSNIAILIVVLGAFLALVATPVYATEEPTETTQPAETTVPVTSDVEPAVPVTAPPPADAQLDWTYRYMIPTLIVLAVIVVLFTTVQYFTSVVRKRYRIVKE